MVVAAVCIIATAVAVYFYSRCYSGFHDFSNKVKKFNSDVDEGKVPGIIFATTVKKDEGHFCIFKKDTPEYVNERTTKYNIFKNLAMKDAKKLVNYYKYIESNKDFIDYDNAHKSYQIDRNFFMHDVLNRIIGNSNIGYLVIFYILPATLVVISIVVFAIVCYKFKKSVVPASEEVSRDSRISANNINNMPLIDRTL